MASAEPLDPWWEAPDAPTRLQIEATIEAAAQRTQDELEAIWRRLLGAGESAAADRFLRAARAHTDEPRRQAFLLHQQALLAANLHRPELFLAYTDSALWQLQRAAVADSIELGMLGLSRASALAELDRRDDALSELQGARALLDRQLGAHDPLRLRIRLLASMCLTNLGEYRQAAALQRENLRALQLVEAHPSMQLGSTHHNLGVSLHAIGELEEARQAWQEALRHFDPGDRPAHPHAGTTWLNLASLELQLGRYAEARVALSHAMDHYERAGRPPDLLLGGTLSALGASFLFSGDLEDAERWLQRALTAIAKVQPDNHPTQIATRHWLARTRLELGRPDEALPLLREALALESTRSRRVFALRPQLTRELGRALAASGEHGAAETAFASALEQLLEESSERPALRARLELDLALLRNADRAPLEALLDQLGATDRADAALEIVRRLRARGEGAAAFELAARTLQDGRARARESTQLMGEIQALRHARSLQHLLAEAIDSLEELPDQGHVEQAFLALARTRGLVQDEMLRRQRLRASADDPELEAAWTELECARSQLHYLRELAWSFDAIELAQERQAEAQLRAERAEIRFAMHSRAPGNAEREFELAELRRALPERSTLISYVHWQGRSGAQYGAFVLENAALRWVPLGPAAAIERAIDALGEHMQHAATMLRLDPVGTESAATRILGELSTLLFEPLGIAAGASLCIVPDQRVHRVAFAALCDRGGTPLLDRTQSLHRLAAESELLRPTAPARPPQLLLIEGVPDALPGAARELEAIAAIAARAGIAQVDRRCGSELDERALAEAVRGRSILHFASHGRPGDQDQLLPQGAIEIAGCADGLLDALELSAFPLGDVQWCVLSSCLSADGRTWPGEGVLGLQRALRSAGARTLLVSLWPLEDRFAEELMGELYARRLLEGASTADALSGARHALRDSLRARGWSAHPLRWAGVIALGDWR